MIEIKIDHLKPILTITGLVESKKEISVDLATDDVNELKSMYGLDYEQKFMELINNYLKNVERLKRLK